MNGETWVVKNLAGNKLGSIRKVIIDSQTRQIAYADLELADTHQIVRVPWSIFTVKNSAILLVATKEQFLSTINQTHPDALRDPVALEVATTAPGKIRQGTVIKKASDPRSERTSVSHIPSR